MLAFCCKAFPLHAPLIALLPRSSLSCCDKRQQRSQPAALAPGWHSQRARGHCRAPLRGAAHGAVKGGALLSLLLGQPRGPDAEARIYARRAKRARQAPITIGACPGLEACYQLKAAPTGNQAASSAFAAAAYCRAACAICCRHE